MRLIKSPVSTELRVDEPLSIPSTRYITASAVWARGLGKARLTINRIATQIPKRRMAKCRKLISVK
jgi:hypothetical protein